ncbi:unnamed protein product, partial [Adineta ricciae]
MSSSSSSTNYEIVAPISILFAFVAIVIAFFILVLVASTKQLRTACHLLTCNTCLSSILYCIVQCNNYIYLLFIKSNTSDDSCRWRGYFGYISIVAVVYSYLLQAISRLLFTVLAMKYRWMTSFKIHFCLIIIGWFIVFLIPLPALLTDDIKFRSGFLCWVPRQHLLHAIYTILLYYLIPIVLIIAIYVSIYLRVHSHTNNNNTLLQDRPTRKNRDLEVL